MTGVHYHVPVTREDSDEHSPNNHPLSQPLAKGRTRKQTQALCPWRPSEPSSHLLCAVQRFLRKHWGIKGVCFWSHIVCFLLQQSALPSLTPLLATLPSFPLPLILLSCFSSPFLPTLPTSTVIFVSQVPFPLILLTLIATATHESFSLCSHMTCHSLVNIIASKRETTQVTP